MRGKFLKPKTPKVPEGSPGKRLYAIGDVHGCDAQLAELLELIAEDNARRRARPTFLVFLGDLIDRGPASREVIRRLRTSPPRFAGQHLIRGNHEEMMVRALSGEPHLIRDWLSHGGEACARSYGADPARLLTEDAETLEHLLTRLIPPEDIRFLDASVDQVRFGDYLLVHAGVRPGVPLEAQSGRDLRWIRAEFLDSAEDFGAVVVHGHTIGESVVQKPNRIGLDTGAYRTGVLTAICLEGTERSFLSVGGA